MTARADCQTMPKMAIVISKPMIGSAKGKPAQTPKAPRATAKLATSVADSNTAMTEPERHSSQSQPRRLK